MTYEEMINANVEEHNSVGEPALRLEASVEEKISYLRANLHPSTVEHLEMVDWMLDKPFPYDDCDPDDDSWVDEAEAVGDSDIVPIELQKHLPGGFLKNLKKITIISTPLFHLTHFLSQKKNGCRWLPRQKKVDMLLQRNLTNIAKHGATSTKDFEESKILNFIFTKTNYRIY